MITLNSYQHFIAVKNSIKIILNIIYNVILQRIGLW